MAQLQTEHCRKLLEQLPEPKGLWKWMLWCAEIPRGSGHTEQFRAKLLEAAKALGLEAVVDQTLNVKIIKPASPGLEHLPTICLQAHQDIVNASSRSDYNPLTDGVTPLIKDGWLVADRTSLGADDGMGIATAMYILEDKTLKHPKIEFLCTDDEETGTTGAQGLTSSFLCPKTKYFINIDSEDKEALCLGSAGGGDVNITIPIKREALPGQTETLSVKLSGLSGGHSGCDIHLFKANAFKLLSRILLSCWETGFSMAHLEGGSARNAIPAFATAVVVVPTAQVGKFKETVDSVHKMLLTEYVFHEKAGFAISIEPAPSAVPFTRKNTRTILNMWKLTPSHPMRMSPDMKDLVETSCATTLCKTFPDHLLVSALARTSRDSQWHDIEQHMQALTEFVEGTITITGKYPGWLPQPDSKLSKVAQSAHQKVLGKPCRVYAVHAGLECGLLLEKYPGCEAISIGPQVENPHSVHERCEIATAGVLLDWVIQIIKDLSQ